VWKLIEAAGAVCIVMHSFGVGKMFVSLGQVACISRCGNCIKQLTKSLPHRAMWQASSMALTNLLLVNFQNVMAITQLFCRDKKFQTVLCNAVILGRTPACGKLLLCQ